MPPPLRSYATVFEAIIPQPYQPQFMNEIFQLLTYRFARGVIVRRAGVFRAGCTALEGPVEVTVLVVRVATQMLAIFEIAVSFPRKGTCCSSIL